MLTQYIYNSNTENSTASEEPMDTTVPSSLFLSASGFCFQESCFPLCMQCAPHYKIQQMDRCQSPAQISLALLHTLAMLDLTCRDQIPESVKAVEPGLGQNPLVQVDCCQKSVFCDKDYKLCSKSPKVKLLQSTTTKVDDSLSLSALF